jgi:sugar/nucleoside kinase (ribokinase family)
VLATLGDLIDDIVVRLDGPINVATDTASSIARRRGGSAANVAATGGLLGQRVRFLGQVGDDAIGTALIEELAAAGADTQFVHRSGTTGTIVVLVDDTGERSMLTDRGASAGLTDPQPEWLDGVRTLHVPLYSLFGGRLAQTARTVIESAHERDVGVSLDLSSTALLREVGVDVARELVADLRPNIVFANSDEAAAFGLDNIPDEAIAVVKDGGAAAMVRIPASSPGTAIATLMIPAIGAGQVEDTTAAGDAFAAGFLTFREWRTDPAEACVHAHRAAHRTITGERR